MIPIIAAIAKAGLSFMQEMGKNAQTKAMSRAMADSYRSQARLNFLTTANQDVYSNMELADAIFNLREQANEFKGAQITGLSASGFSLSTGDKRLLTETERKTQEMTDTLNRQAYLETFERYRQAYLNDIQYQAQAKIADVNAKYASGWRGFASAVGNASISALGSFFQFSQPSGKIDNVGFGNNVGFTNNLPSHVGKLDYSGKVNLSGAPRMF